MADRFDEATQVRGFFTSCLVGGHSQSIILEGAAGIPRAGAGTGARPAVDSYIHQHVLGQVRSRSLFKYHS